MKKQTSIFFYVLSIYVILQFTWWGYHLVDLTKEIESAESSKRVFMVFSEGMVFFFILLLGLWKIRSSMKKELTLSERQNNFLLSVTHELKTPLAASKLYLQTILKRELDSTKRNELIEKALSENARLESMINNILHASRLENNAYIIHQEKIDISQFLTEIKDRYNKILQKPLIELEIKNGITIEGDRFMLSTIIHNLVENAIKYAGTELPIILYAYPQNSHFVLGVKDQGKGINSLHQEDIFKKFVRLENEETRTQKGTGLGLFIVAEFVRMQGGKIRYVNNIPHGANFEITF